MTKDSEKTLDVQQLANAFEYVDFGMVQVALDGKMMSVNSSLCEMLGYTNEELLKKTFVDITFVEDQADDLANRQKLLSNEIENVRREKRYVHKQGQIIWIRLTVSLVREKTGEPKLFIAQTYDITARKLAEVGLLESLNSFKILSEAMPQMVWMTSADGLAIYFNQQWVEYTGVSYEQSLGANWIQPFHPDDQKATMEAWKLATDTGGYYSTEVRLRRFDGIYQWWLIRGLPVRDTSGQIMKWVGTCTNIDELKKALVKAKIREEMIVGQAELINQTRDSIIKMSLDGEIEVWTRGAERLYGWSSAEALGRKDIELYAIDCERRTESFRSVLASGHWEGEFHRKTRDKGEIIVESRLSLVKDSHGKPQSIIAVSTDITEKKRNQTHALRSQRLESIGTLAGGIAHDLNNMLTPIMMSIELLRIGEADNQRLETLETIESCAQRGAEMIRQLLLFSRGVEGERLELRPDKILQDIQKITSDTFLKIFQISCHISPHLHSIKGDVTQLHQVLLNLCVNARDAMPNGGQLMISGKNIVLTKQDMNEEYPPGAYVLISVEDTGMGMSKEILDRVFEPFFTTKEFGKGTGLGLSTSIAIINSHKGFVRVYSEIGVGTKFNVYLPAIEAQNSARIESAHAESLPQGSGEWILVVDDESTIQLITKKILEKAGYKVHLAGEGLEALSLYTLHQDQIEVVLTDMMMPGLDGLLMIQELRKINPEIRIITSSGLSSPAAVAAGQFFLSKPYTAESLLKTVLLALAIKSKKLTQG
jgi:PAS domain S-box-containing protein